MAKETGVKRDLPDAYYRVLASIVASLAEQNKLPTLAQPTNWTAIRTE